jgi:hypothetical protein
VAEELLLDFVELDELLDELELLPHADRPSASNATLASAPILFLVTTSPLAGLRVVLRFGARRKDRAEHLNAVC